MTYQLENLWYVFLYLIFNSIQQRLFQYDKVYPTGCTINGLSMGELEWALGYSTYSIKRWPY